MRHLHHHRPARLAFTVIELLTAIFVVALLVSICLPAMSAGRESARRVSCSSNLRELSLAALLETEISGRYFRYGRPVRRLLPNLSSVYEHDGATSHGDWPSHASEPLLKCPSEVVPNRGGDIVSYRPCSGVGRRHSDINSKLSGVYALNKPDPIAGPQHVIDGTSHTALLSERMINRPAVPRPNDDRLGIWALHTTPSSLQKFASLCVPSSTIRPVALMNLDPAGGDLHGVYSHVTAPNSRGCLYGSRSNLPLSKEYRSEPATSYHPHGVNVAFADGHVSFTNEAINVPTWRELSTISSESTHSASF